MAGAAGDALGYTVEFWSENQIFRQYGQSGITEYEPVCGLARISDDTQMTIFTASGLIAALKGKGFFDRRTCREQIALSYLDWYETQTGSYDPGAAGPEHPLLGEKRLFSRRAPGNTCLSALGMGGGGTMEEPLNHSKGCGGIMRVAPIALGAAGRQELMREADLLAADASAITHGHPLGWIPSAAIVHMLQEICLGISMREAAQSAISVLPELFPENGYVPILQEQMRMAMDLAEGDLEDLEAIHRLGEGWVADETLTIAMFCALRYPDDLERCLIAAVNHQGDSDSTGAVAGNLVGAAIGYDAIPEKFRRNLELDDVILSLADQLAEMGTNIH